MKCGRCKEDIGEGEEKEMHGRTLCEDCYIDALSPAKACDPWAVYAASSFSKQEGATVQTTEIQSRILELLKETGGAEPAILSEKLRITTADLEREIATLRHMEKVRAELREGRKVICLW
ncbi:MAG: hypothetical protein PVG78_11995 [Desulfobacterales bacterium]|jgi:hypothetical protein